MRFIYCSILLVLLIVGCGQDSEGRLIPRDAAEELNTFNPLWEYEENWYSSGNLESVTAYDEASQIVFKKSYHPSGKIRREVPYKRGKPHGVEKRYYLNGEFKSKRTYVKGQLQGMSFNFNESGKILSSVHYNQGIPQGSNQVKKEKLEVKKVEQLTPQLQQKTNENVQYKENLSESVVTVIEEPEKETISKNTPVKKSAVQDGIVKEYYSTGELKWERAYENGKKIGISKRYSRSGHLIKKIYHDADGSSKVIYDSIK